MATADYNFTTEWRFAATAEEVSAILGDVEGLSRWWPSVYLGVTEITPGDAHGIGRVIDLYTKGWLPYTLRWRFRVVEVVPYRRLVLAAEGDFVGTGTWTITPDGDHTDVRYEWNIRAEKPLLKRLTWLLRPLFAANHEWAMRQGYESLNLELTRRRARTEGERQAIDAPPPPSSPWPFYAAAIGVVALIGIVWWKRRA